MWAISANGFGGRHVQVSNWACDFIGVKVC